MYAANGVDLVLNIDGIVRVKEVGLQGARMIMLPREGREQVVTADLDHFQMTLELQTAYLFSFEAHGMRDQGAVFRHPRAGGIPG
jgi:hypothetical protein